MAQCRICTDKKAVAHGLCATHYQRVRRAGSTSYIVYEVRLRSGALYISGAPGTLDARKRWHQRLVEQGSITPFHAALRESSVARWKVLWEGDDCSERARVEAEYRNRARKARRVLLGR